MIIFVETIVSPERWGFYFPKVCEIVLMPLENACPIDFGEIILFPSLFLVGTLELTYLLVLGVYAVIT